MENIFQSLIIYIFNLKILKKKKTIGQLTTTYNKNEWKKP